MDMRMQWKAALLIFWLTGLLHRTELVTDPRDTAALKAFLARVHDPFSKLQNWQGNEPCDDEWEGVFCSDALQGIRSITELRLLNHNLTGELVADLGNLKNLEVLDLMWNQITGSIPPDLGNLSRLRLLLLNGNNLTGSIPPELGYLQMMDRFQIDLNQISGPIPESFSNLTKVKHLHLNNNSLSGPIPAGLGRLPLLLHLLLDNNELVGDIPAELGGASSLRIIQLDNNRFNSAIPETFGQIFNLTKLSLRNCNLHGQIPDLTGLPNLEYLDLSNNLLEGGIPNLTSRAITTIDLSNNLINGTVPEDFGQLPNLQTLLLRNNNLAGHIPESLAITNGFTTFNASVVMDFQNNSLSTLPRRLINTASLRFQVWLNGNPVCNHVKTSVKTRILCLLHAERFLPENRSMHADYGPTCLPITCSPGEEPIPSAYFKLGRCYCAFPITIGYRLKSPSFSFFTSYVEGYEQWIAKGINVSSDQVKVDSFVKEPGPRFATNLKIFPLAEGARVFSEMEVTKIFNRFSRWELPANDTYGPQELLFFNYTRLGVSLDLEQSAKKMSWGVIVAIIIGCIATTTVIISASLYSILRYQRHSSRSGASGKRYSSGKSRSARRPINVTGVKEFTFEELSLATKSFSDFMQVGQGGYGKVYRGILSDGQVVAIKRAKEDSLQGTDEFYNEIEMLSRVHHRNLVSLLGYCVDEDEQMLVYEFMANGTLRDHLSSSRSKTSLDFATRLRIALGAARGILYLHIEANPPIFHRDIKATNILLDEKKNAKVADFGLSKLAPNPEIEGSAPGYVSTVVKGTPGYLDPEYFLTHKLTDKSDVYSFGVVLLELLTGLQPIAQGKNIVREVKYAYENGMMLHMLDPRMGSYPAEGLEPWVKLALSCCKDNTAARPSMSEVVRDLEDTWRLVPWSDSMAVSDLEADADSKFISEKDNPKSLGIKNNHYISYDAETSGFATQNMIMLDPR